MGNEQEIQWIWEPFISIGSIKFGEFIEPLIIKFGLEKLEKPFEDCSWETYRFPDCNTCLYSEDSQVTSAGCFDNLYYKGRNLFGLTIDEIRNTLGQESEIGETIKYYIKEEEVEQIPVEFDELSLQIWFGGGLVESAIVHGSLEDE
jgi:hypothetical protein